MSRISALAEMHVRMRLIRLCKGVSASVRCTMAGVFSCKPAKKDLMVAAVSSISATCSNCCWSRWKFCMRVCCTTQLMSCTSPRASGPELSISERISVVSCCNCCTWACIVLGFVVRHKSRPPADWAKLSRKVRTLSNSSTLKTCSSIHVLRNSAIKLFDYFKRNLYSIIRKTSHLFSSAVSIPHEENLLLMITVSHCIKGGRFPCAAIK